MADDKLLKSMGIDIDHVDLRSLAAQSKSEHLRLVLDEQKKRYRYLIDKALVEQEEERKKKEKETGIKKMYEIDDPDYLTRSLLAQWVDTVPEIDEDTLASDLTPAGTIGDDETIRKRKRKQRIKERREREEEERVRQERARTDTDGAAAAPLDALRDDDGDEDADADGAAAAAAAAAATLRRSLDDRVPMGVGMTPLLLASASERRESYECMRLLLEAGADPEARQPLTLAGPLHLVCLRSVRGSESGVAQLSQGGPVTTTTTTTTSNNPEAAAAAAIQDKNILLAKIQLLLDYDADVNGVDTANMTPLHAACLAGQSHDIVSLLLSNRANPNMQDNAMVKKKFFFRTPFFCCCHY